MGCEQVSGRTNECRMARPPIIIIIESRTQLLHARTIVSPAIGSAWSGPFRSGPSESKGPYPLELDATLAIWSSAAVLPRWPTSAKFKCSGRLSRARTKICWMLLQNEFTVGGSRQCNQVITRGILRGTTEVGRRAETVEAL